MSLCVWTDGVAQSGDLFCGVVALATVATMDGRYRSSFKVRAPMVSDPASCSGEKTNGGNLGVGDDGGLQEPDGCQEDIKSDID